MSAELKGKYEVLKIIRDNVLLGIAAFGEEGWGCAEADQPGIKNMDKVVTLKYNKMERVGIQNSNYVPDEDDPTKMNRVEEWIEQQEWQIKVLWNRFSNEAVTANTHTVEDIAYMLAAWFNGQGVEEFRKNGCGNLFVNFRDIKMYSDESGVPQNAASFPLKLHVPKRFVMKYPDAGVEFKGLVKV